MSKGKRLSREKGRKMFSWPFLKSVAVAATVAADKCLQGDGLGNDPRRMPDDAGGREEGAPPSFSLVSK